MVSSIDRLSALATYAHVVEAKSFTAAAAKLGVSKSVVSARVSALEANLGVRLLHRTTRRLSLTEDGARLYEQSARILRASEDAIAVVADAGTLPQGTLRVTATVGFGLMRLTGWLPEFLDRYPNVRIDLALSDQTVDIAKQGFDVALRVAARLSEPTLVARRVGSDQWLVCAHPDYLREKGIPRTPQDLSVHNCLRFAPLREHDQWTFRRPDGPIVIPVSGNLMTDNVVALRAALLSGLGIAVMPRSIVADDLDAGTLVEILGEHPLGNLGVYVVHTHGAHPPAKVRVFSDFLTEKLSATKKRAKAIGR